MFKTASVKRYNFKTRWPGPCCLMSSVAKNALIIVELHFEMYDTLETFIKTVGHLSLRAFFQQERIATYSVLIRNLSNHDSIINHSKKQRECLKTKISEAQWVCP